MSEKLKTFGRKQEQIKEELRMPEIRELELPVKNILNQIKPEIENGTYKIVLGDDSSGRVPALIFGKVLDELYKKRNIKRPDVKFIGPSSQWADDMAPEEVLKKWKKFARELKKVPDLKILIVTEALLHGSRLTPVVEMLKKESIPFDVATIVSLRRERHDQDGEIYFDNLERMVEFKKFIGPARVLEGIVAQYSELDTERGKNPPPLVYGRSDISGVEKVYSSLFSFRHSSRGEYGSQMSQARKEATTLAHKIAEDFEK